MSLYLTRVFYIPLKLLLRQYKVYWRQQVSEEESISRVYRVYMFIRDNFTKRYWQAYFEYQKHFIYVLI